MLENTTNNAPIVLRRTFCGKQCIKSVASQALAGALIALACATPAKAQTAIGIGASAGLQGTAVGVNAQAADFAVAIGEEAKALAPYSMAIGFASTATQSYTVSFGSGGLELPTGTARLVNVSDGINLTDAATVGQLGNAVATVSSIASDAQAAALTAQALAVDVYQAADQIYGVALDAQSSATLALERVEQVSNQLNELSARVGNMQTEYRAGIAGVAAMQTAMPTIAPGESAMALGAGHFGGQGAIALSFAKAAKNGAVYSAGISMNASHSAARVGVSWKLN